MVDQLKITVQHRGTTHVLESLDPTSTLVSLQDRLYELTSIPVSLQKLLYKGKRSGKQDAEHTTLTEAGLKDGAKVTLLGSTNQEVETMEDAVKTQQKKESILRERALKPAVKLRSTGSSSTSSLKYMFHSIQALPSSHYPTPPTSEAQAYLSKLASDPAIKHIMNKYQFSVGLLTELSPAEFADPSLLGLNKNAGESISLRIRTNDLKGFRHYATVRRTLCHELTHNVWGPHDNNFKELCSRLNQDVAEYERQQVSGSHRLIDGDHYEPVEQYAAQEHVLGGVGTIAQAPLTAEERRSKVLEAALRRLRLQDEEIEAGCGTAGPAQRLDEAHPGEGSAPPGQ